MLVFFCKETENYLGKEGKHNGRRAKGTRQRRKREGIDGSST
jgi:hypothetical protein